VWQRFCDRFLKRPLLTVFRRFMNVANSVLWRMAIILKVNKLNLFVSSVLFVFCYHSPNVLDTPRTYSAVTRVYNATVLPYAIAFPILLVFHLGHMLDIIHILPYFYSLYSLQLLCLFNSPRTTSLDTTRTSTIFFQLLLNWASLRRH
jgi:hypothetical protein